MAVVDRAAGTTKSRERSETQNARIRNAAVSAFIDQGFQAANMWLFAKRASMSLGLIYRYYGSKNEIMLAMIECQPEDSRAVVRALYSSNNPAQTMSDTYLRWCGQTAP